VRPHVQLLERPLRLPRRQVKRIIRRKTQSLHPLAKPRDEAEVSAQNFAQFVCLGGSQVVRIHLARSVHRLHERQAQQEDGFES